MTRVGLHAARSARERGFSAVEVIVSMTVFVIGAAGVIAMQRAAIRGNMEARQLDMGSAIAREWMERLQRDAARWGSLDSNGNPVPLSKTLWLKDTGTAPTAGVTSFASAGGGGWTYPPMQGGAWTLPTVGTPIKEGVVIPGSPGGSPAFDLLGRECATPGNCSNNVRAMFCAQYRLQAVLHEPPTSIALDQTTLIRAEVRVFWPRGFQGAPAGFCTTSDTVVDDPVAGPRRYIYLYSSTVLRETRS